MCGFEQWLSERGSWKLKTEGTSVVNIRDIQAAWEYKDKTHAADCLRLGEDNKKLKLQIENIKKHLDIFYLKSVTAEVVAKKLRECIKELEK